MHRFLGKVAMVTGGTSGIGESTAKILAEEGASVIVVGRNIQRGELFEKKMTASGCSVHFFQADVSSTSDIDKLKEFVVAEYGHLNILFNNAGILLTGSIEELSDEEWDRSYNVNVKSILHMCQAFLPMMKKGHGVLLNNASNVGLQTYIQGKRSYMYASSKAAVIQLTRHIAKNYAPEIRANVICPGVTKTNIFTNRDFSRFSGVNLLDRVAEPEEIAKVAAFLLSDDSSFMTGSIIVADGGETIK